jgi:hypothetical protein
MCYLSEQYFPRCGHFDKPIPSTRCAIGELVPGCFTTGCWNSEETGGCISISGYCPSCVFWHRTLRGHVCDWLLFHNLTGLIGLIDPDDHVVLGSIQKPVVKWFHESKVAHTIPLPQVLLTAPSLSPQAPPVAQCTNPHTLPRTAPFTPPHTPPVTPPSTPLLSPKIQAKEARSLRPMGAAKDAEKKRASEVPSPESRTQSVQSHWPPPRMLSIGSQNAS